MLSAVTLFAEAFAEEDFANVFAWHVTDARTVDPEWVAEAEHLLARTHEYLGRLVLIARDENYRQQCAYTDEGRENARAALRVV